MARKSGFDEGNLPEAAFFILLALKQTRHGYSIMQFLEERTGGLVAIGPASLYTTLKKLFDAGLIEEVSASDDGERRRSYRMTDKGMAVAATNVERREQLVAAAQNLLTETDGENNV